MKKSIYALFLCLCLVSLFGCGAKTDNMDVVSEKNAFRLCRQADSSGKLAVSYIFPVNSTELSSLGFEDEDLKVYRFFLSTYVNALAKQHKEKAFDGVTVSPCTYFTDVDGIGFSLIFADLQTQNKFFGVQESDDKEKNDNQVISGFFFKKLTLTANFPFSVKTAEDYKTICKLAMTGWCKESAKAEARKTEIFAILDDSQFIYDFASTESKLKSDCTYEDENFVHHVFAKDIDQINENPKIKFWVSVPNAPVWYLSALVVVISGMIVAYLCLRNKKKKT